MVPPTDWRKTAHNPEGQVLISLAERLAEIRDTPADRIRIMAKQRAVSPHSAIPFTDRELDWVDDEDRSRMPYPLLTPCEAFVMIRQLASDLRSARDEIARLKQRTTPAAVAASEPTCPHCGTIHDMPPMATNGHKIDCDCGWRFEAVRSTQIISRPMEHRQ